ncbi:hypothetical protein PtrM4_025780 [Pyrenophora tritici-repentis]|nr:hypothetical protein PtrM4_025780 [Pyrenophora tritici-repentis]
MFKTVSHLYRGTFVARAFFRQFARKDLVCRCRAVTTTYLGTDASVASRAARMLPVTAF